MAEGGSRSVMGSPGSQDLDGDTEVCLRRLLAELDSNAHRSLTQRQLRGRVWEAPDASNRVTTGLRLRVMRGIGGSESLVKVTLVHLEMTADEVAELCQALKPNRVMERLVVSKIPEFGLLEGCEQVAEMLTENRSLKELELRGTGMGSEGFERITNSLRQRDASLESLNVSDNEELGDEGARHMAEALQHVALKSLHMSRTGMTRSGAVVLAAALSKNSCLEELNLSNNGLGSSGVTALLEPFREVRPRSADASTGGSSSKSGTKSCCVKKLHVATWESVRGCGQAVADVLQGTTLLTVLNLAGFDLSRREWIQVFQSLKNNSTLQTLILKGCSTVGGDSVYYSLMALLDNNTCLRKIELEGTDLHSSGKAEAVREKLRINGQAYVAVLKELDHEKPKSARIFLCGYPYAGKTALRTSMMRAERRQALTAALHSEFLANMCVSFQELLTQQLHSCRRRFDENEIAQRTRGIEIEVLKDDADDLRVTVWDLAGQEEFHSLQDCMFPDVHSACIFIFVFSAVDRRGRVKESTALKQELQYWLKFIASTSRRSSAKETPKVIVVVTHRDKAIDLRLTNCKPVIKQLGKDFEGFVDVDTSIHSVDATAYQEAEDVLRHAFEKLRVLVTDKKVPKACDQVRLLVQDWISEHPNRPTMSSGDFFSLCKQAKSLKDMADLPPNTMATRRKAVASYLHNVGEIIYFEELDFVVVNPHWFCHGILGQLIEIGASSRPANPSEAGFMTRDQLHRLLVQSIPSCTRRPSSGCFRGSHLADPLVEVQDLFKLMLKIELCYEIEPGNPDAGFFIPAILDDALTAAAAAKGERQLHWPDAGSASSSTAFSFLGRRLECDERNRTFLTPGFFPRLQVILRKEYLSKEWKGEYTIQRNLITVSHDGIDILVEHSGSIGYFVDVLVRSRPCFSQEETLRFVQENVLTVIREFCASHMGCQGVSLVEAAIRTECVSGLTLCRHRQAARVETLKERLQRSQQPQFQHSWSVDVAGHLGSNMEPVVHLLGREDAKDALLHRPLRALQSVAAAALVPHPAQDSSESESRESLLRQVLAKLDSLGRKVETLDSLQHSVAALHVMQSDMLRELLPRLDDILGFAVEAKQREFPRLLFLTEPAESFRRKLIAKLVPGRHDPVTINFMCEHRECPHVVLGAPGVTVTIRDQLARDVERFLRPTLKLLSLLVRVAAHVGAGIGNAIPNFSNLPEALGLTLGGLVVEEVANDVGGNEARDATSTLAESNSLLTLLKGHNIAEKFMLHQVRYKRKEKREAHIAWICSQHRDEGQNNQTLDALSPTFHPL